MTRTHALLMFGTLTLALVVPFAAHAATLQAPQPQAQPPAPKTPPGKRPATGPSTPPPAALVPSVAPPDFIIGPDDLLSVVFWREKDLSSDVVVRPDGRISIPLLNDVQASGLTPAQLRDKLVEAAGQFLEDPNATVIVKQINSRRVFITGSVNKPGPYPLTAPTTVVQLIALAGGLQEFSDSKNIVVLRTVKGQPVSMAVNYRDISRGKNMKQNIELQPGDTVIVP